MTPQGVHEFMTYIYVTIAIVGLPLCAAFAITTWKDRP